MRGGRVSKKTGLGRSLTVACVLAAVSLAHAAEPVPPDSTWRLAVPGEGEVFLQAPESWVGKEKKLSSSQTSIEFRPASGDAGLFLVTLLFEKPPEERTGEGEKGPSALLPEMREKLERTRNALVPQATPPSKKHHGVPAIQEFRGESVTGYYFSFSGKRTKPDTYRHQTIGSALLGEVPISFVVSSNTSPGDLVAATIAMLKAAKWEPPEDEEHERDE